ncbi:MAG: aminoacyl-tRNA hydrolase [Puniceicoccales bacterium]|jgi:PTH1 family peptidyl-tRNA hydrolase|nr:aminoacyl-tRNA hydrolase [Puniceicoccales bacterium]
MVDGARGAILLVGLGNPGASYIHTRHNLGQFVLDNFARHVNVKWVNNKKLNADLARGSLDGFPFILARPLCCVNQSGYPVARISKYFHVANNRVAIIYDELNLPLGEVKITVRPGDGGHNGMADVCEKLGECIRFRVGIGQKPNKELDLKEYVLARFSDEEQAALFYAMPAIFDNLKNIIARQPTFP